MTVQIWDAGPYELGEGARRVGDRLVFVDILSGRLLEASPTHPGSARVLAELDVPLGAVAPVAGRPGSWIAAAGTGIGVLSGAGFEWLDRPEDGGPVDTRMNDAVCDPAGRFWAGSMAYDHTPGAGSLYRVDPDGAVSRVLDGLTIVNGPAFDATGAVMYVNDTPTGRILRYAVDDAGEIGTGGEFISVPAEQGAPDGLTVDDAGHLWVAMWGGARVHRYDPGGELVEVLRLPAQQPTSVCLGTAEEASLVVTTATEGLRSPSAADGAVLRASVSASAPPARAWGAASG